MASGAVKAHPSPDPAPPHVGPAWAPLPWWVSRLFRSHACSGRCGGLPAQWGPWLPTGSCCRLLNAPAQARSPLWAWVRPSTLRAEALGCVSTGSGQDKPWGGSLGWPGDFHWGPPGSLSDAEREIRAWLERLLMASACWNRALGWEPWVCSPRLGSEATLCAEAPGLPAVTSCGSAQASEGKF